MKLQVQYTAQLRGCVGQPEEHVELPDGSSLLGLLRQLAARWDRARQHLLTDLGQPRPSLLVVVNGVAIPAHEAGDSVLQAGDVVVLMPPIAGG
jgi:MoaD family protein